MASMRFYRGPSVGFSGIDDVVVAVAAAMGEQALSQALVLWIDSMGRPMESCMTPSGFTYLPSLGPLLLAVTQARICEMRCNSSPQSRMLSNILLLADSGCECLRLAG